MEALKRAQRLSNNPPADGEHGTPTERKGQPLDVATGTNEVSWIGNHYYVGHALDEMQSDGITPGAVEDGLSHGVSARSSRPNTTAVYDATNDITVLTNTKGWIVTLSRGGARNVGR